MGDALLNKITKREYKELNIQQCNLFLVGIPNEFSDITYGEFFKDYCHEQKIIPIGLYRVPVNSPDNRSGLRQNKPFVFTNPLPEIEIHPGDKVFVLAPREPEMVGRDSVLEINAEKARMRGFKAKDKAEQEIIDILHNLHNQLIDVTQ